MKKYFFVGTLIFLCVAIALAPARIVSRILEDVDGIDLLDPQGTVWRGNGLLLVQGERFGQLVFSFRPASLLALTPEYDWALEHPAGPLEGQASADTKTIYATINGTFAAAAINPWLAPYDINLSGDFTLENLSLSSPHGAAYPSSAEGVITWSGGRTRYTLGGLLREQQLGSLRAVFAPNEDGEVGAIVSQANDAVPLIVASLARSGFTKIGVTQAFTQLLGTPYPSQGDPAAVVIQIEEQFF